MANKSKVVLIVKRYELLSEFDFFDTLKEKCSEEELDALERELRWYEYEATDEDIGECGEHLSDFLRFAQGGFGDWLECLIETKE